jgi:maleamate amidohydrolase
MSDAEAREVYDRACLGGSMTRGSSPAVVVIDFQRGFTDPECSLGADATGAVLSTRRVLDVARARGLPVVFTAIGFDRSGIDGALWLQKVPTLAELELGSRWLELDPRLGAREEEAVLLKKGASGFFGTNLASVLVAAHVDTIVLCGATTSGCVRATAVDALQYGFPAIVPRDCVADRAQAPHEANLLDIQAKYGDVLPVGEVLSYLESVPARAVPARA